MLYGNSSVSRRALLSRVRHAYHDDIAPFGYDAAVLDGGGVATATAAATATATAAGPSNPDCAPGDGGPDCEAGATEEADGSPLRGQDRRLGGDEEETQNWMEEEEEEEGIGTIVVDPMPPQVRSRDACMHAWHACRSRELTIRSDASSGAAGGGGTGAGAAQRGRGRGGGRRA